MMSQAEIQAKIAQWEQALKDQEAIIQEHQTKAEYCKTVLEGLKYDLEHEHFA